MIKSLDRSLYVIRSLQEKYLCVRAVDAAHFLQVSKPSVSVAIRQMQAQGLIKVESDGNLQFTALGKNRSDLLGSRVCFF